MLAPDRCGGVTVGVELGVAVGVGFFFFADELLPPQPVNPIAMRNIVVSTMRFTEVPPGSACRRCVADANSNGRIGSWLRGVIRHQEIDACCRTGDDEIER